MCDTSAQIRAPRRIVKAARQFAKGFHRATRWRFSSNLSVTYDQECGTYRVYDGEKVIHVARLRRVELQMGGIIDRQEFLFREYTAGLCSLRTGDIVVDCGANIGEFTLACRRRGAVVHAFEPDPAEFNALCLNSDGSVQANNVALWRENATLKFYLENQSGDSSLLRQRTSSGSITVRAMRLAEYLDERAAGQRIRLFKLEAEGAEPEVIEGASAVLDRIEYVAADVGPERGLERENTLVQVVNLLGRRGFSLAYFNSERCTALFENDKMVST